MERAIFIGLGGSGSQVVGHLKAKLLEHVGRDATLLARECRFLFLDTDHRDIDELNTLYHHLVDADRDFIQTTERINVGVVNPRFEYDRMKKGQSAEREWFLSWFDESGLPLLVDRPLRDGASANRQQGRIAVWRLWSAIDGAVSREATALAPAGDPDARPPLFYIVSGTCGGTGSSSYLDIAYLIDRLARRYRGAEQGGPTIRATFMMPHIFVEAQRKERKSEELIDVYQANAYAFFSELDAVLEDAFRLGDGTKFHAAAVREIPSEEEPVFSPFSLAFCVDHRTERGQLMQDPKQLYRSTAELLLYWHVGSGKDTFISGFDNEYRRELVSGPSEVPAFQTIGYAALRFPGDEFLDYLRTRFVFEALNSGVLGDEYERALPDVTLRFRHVDESFRERICRYVFQDHADPELPNLERDRRQAAQAMIDSFQLDLFKEPKRNRIDPNFVGDEDRLKQFEDTADKLCSDIERELYRLSRDGVASRAEVLKGVFDGVATPRVQVPGLDDLIEETILQYGTRYTIGFLEGLDGHCGDRVKDLLSEAIPNKLQERLRQLQAEVSHAHEQCLQVRAGKKEDAVNALHALLLERLQLTMELVIARQQVDVLNALCLGESGLIDYRIRFLSRLVSQLASDSWRREYEFELPQRFAETADDVTTVYAPDIARFVNKERDWVSDNAFAAQYRRLVPQRAGLAGAELPMRASGTAGSTAREGLHRLLWDMLAGTYAVGGSLQFFRRGFGEPATWTEAQLIDELVRAAKQHIELLAHQQKEVNEFMTGSLLQHFKHLAEADQARLRARFDDAGCQVFCQTDGHDGSVSAVYAGDDEALAEKLGYRRGNHQFVYETESSRILRIKVVTRMKLSQYAGYGQLRNAYERLKGTSNITHIHRAFQRHGAKRGLRTVVVEHAGSEQRNVFAQLLFYRALMNQAKTTLPSNLAALVDVDDSFLGAQRRLISPLTIEGDNIYLCHTLTTDDHGRLQILERNCHRLRGPLKPQELLKRLESLGGDVFAAALEFDDVVRQKLHSDWVGLMDKVETDLLAKLKDAAQKGGAGEQFFTELHDAIVSLARDLKTIAATRPPLSIAPPILTDDVDFAY